MHSSSCPVLPDPFLSYAFMLVLVFFDHHLEASAFNQLPRSSLSEILISDERESHIFSAPGPRFYFPTSRILYRVLHSTTEIAGFWKGKVPTTILLSRAAPPCTPKHLSRISLLAAWCKCSVETSLKTSPAASCGGPRAALGSALEDPGEISGPKMGVRDGVQVMCVSPTKFTRRRQLNTKICESIIPISGSMSYLGAASKNRGL